MGSIKTFNSAKKFAEEILHPLIKQQTEAKIKTRLGAINDEDASKLNPQSRTVKRFNALKERVTIQQTLSTEIEATVSLNKVQADIKLMGEIQDQLADVEENIDNRSEEIIRFTREGGREKVRLTPLFVKIGRFLDQTYVQLQRLMTKNRLLFYSDDDEYLEDQELKEKIKQDNRRA